MRKKTFALIDCNNFFASCERVFNPSLKNKPIAILSSNDGCIIARSKEVKKLGIPMGAPLYKWNHLIERYNVNVFSANFQLYGDMSNRVMRILKDFSPSVQIYSIDEAFIELSHLKTSDLDSYGKKITETIMKWTGLPVSVGIASTKTLAKVATEYAKTNKKNRNCYILASKNIDSKLEPFSVNKVWGIGFRLAKKLNEQGIYSALDLKNINQGLVRSTLGVTVQRTVMELNEINCLGGIENKKVKKQIISSKSFGRKVSSIAELKESVASYTARASEKLRKQDSICNFIGVSVKANEFKNDANFYYKSHYIPLETPTDYLPDLIKAAHFCLRQIYKNGVYYKKTTVHLDGIVPKNSQKINILQQQYSFKKNKSVMNVFDSINRKWGTEKIKIAASGTKQAWKAKSKLRSPRYTTNWNELVKVNV